MTREELEKENAELKNKLEILILVGNTCTKGLNYQLTKVKELLLELYDCIPASMADSCKETLQKVALFFKDSKVSE